MKNTAIIFIALILSSALVFASHNNNSSQGNCGLTNIKACFTGIFQGFFNAQLKPLLDFFMTLLETETSPELFKPLWSGIVFLSEFIATIFIVINNIKLIIFAGYPVKSYQAKKNLQNIVIIAVLLPLSYYAYNLLLNFNSTLTKNFLENVGVTFFEVKFQGITDSILNFLLFLFYLIALILTDIILILRYFILSVGVVLFPLGIFMYYVDSLKSYGSLIINFLLSNIFAGAITSIIIKILSMLSNIAVFEGFKIIFSIAGLLIADVVLLLIMFFVVVKAGFYGFESVGFLTRYL